MSDNHDLIAQMMKDGVVTYATWNPADKDANITLSNGDLTATEIVGDWISARATIGKSTGKHYFEISIDSTDIYAMNGIGLSNATLNSFVGTDVNGYGYYSRSGDIFHNGSAAYGASYLTTPNIVMCAFDMGSGKVWWGLNGVFPNGGDPAAGTNEAYNGLSGTFFPMISLRDIGSTPPIITANFGASAFAHTVPSGFNEGVYE